MLVVSGRVSGWRHDPARLIPAFRPPNWRYCLDLLWQRGEKRRTAVFLASWALTGGSALD